MHTPFDRPPEEPWRAIATLDTSTLATSACPAEHISITLYQRGQQPCFGWKGSVQGATLYSREGWYEESQEMAEFMARAIVGYYVQHQHMPDVMEYTTEHGKPPRLEYLGPVRPKQDFTQHITIRGGKAAKERRARRQKG